MKKIDRNAIYSSSDVLTVERILDAKEWLLEAGAHNDKYREWLLAQYDIEYARLQNNPTSLEGDESVTERLQ